MARRARGVVPRLLHGPRVSASHDSSDSLARMLVVDDETAITTALQAYFEVHGFVVEVAAARDEALALIAARPYGVVVADLRLTGTTGDEGLDVIRAARQRNGDAAIVLLTAYHTAELERRAHIAGASLLLLKPKPLFEINKSIRALLRDSPDTRHAGGPHAQESTAGR
jgi:DNA-binding response OmpR family regulator